MLGFTMSVRAPRTNQTNQTAANGSGHVRDYWIVILKRLPWVLLLTLVGAALAAYITRNQAPLYRAGATIEMVSPRTGVKTADYVFAPAILQDAQYLNTQLEKLEMPTTLRDALYASNFDDVPEFKNLTLAEVVRMHKDKVTARQRSRQYLVDVTVTGGNPAILDDVTNALVEYFRETQRDETEHRISQRREDLEDKISTLNSKERIAANDKRYVLESAGFTESTFEPSYISLLSELDQFRESHTQVKLKLIEDESTYATFAAAMAEGGDGAESLSLDLHVAQHPDIRAALDAIARFRVELDELRSRDVGKSDPEYQAIERAIERLETQRKELQVAFVKQFISGYKGNSAALERLDSEVAQRKAELTAATSVKARVDELNGEIEILHEDKRTAKRELELLSTGFGSGDAVRIVAPAVEPDKGAPVSPNEPLNYTLGTLLGLLSGVGLAFLLEYLDDTIQTKDELEKVTDVPLLGVIPRIEGRSGDTASKDLYAFHQPKSTVSEAYRGVRTALTMRSRGTRNRVLAFTSAGPREGKSTTVMNLATVLAYASRRTLIVDADLRKPRVHKSFDMDNASGLTNAIVSDANPLDFCRATEVPGVDVLTSGPIPPNPSELLGSDRMREVIEALRARYDHVIIDTPPIGAVTDAAVLGTIVDGIVLVVHAGKTRSSIVQRGLEQMRYISAPIEGVILNNLQVKGRYYPGYYNYYYYYSYYGAGKPRARKPRTDDASEPTAASAAGDRTSTS